MNTTLENSNRNYLIELQRSHGELTDALQALLDNIGTASLVKSPVGKKLRDNAAGALVGAYALME